MFWNILLAVFGALAQLANAWLGYKVTGQTVSPKRKLIYDCIFIGVGLLGASCVGAIAYRGSLSERAHFQFKPSLVYDFPSVDDLWSRAGDWLAVDSPLRLNVHFKNVGSGPATNANHVGRVYIEPDESVSSGHDAVVQFDRWEKLQPPRARGTIAKDETGFITAQGDIVTPEDFKNVTLGRRTVFLVGTFWFDDDFGSHYHNFCWLLEPPREGGHVIPQGCREHTDEK
jgi:hypothetical protein